MEIRRDYYLDKLIRKKDNGFIKIITGIRRSGKSYLQAFLLFTSGSVNYKIRQNIKIYPY